jgi:hypothetical protein
MSPLYRFAALACALILTACGKQGEGERCDLNSGSLDCETGLVCRSADQLSITGRGWALCCPPDDVQPTVNACRAGAELPADDDPVTQPPTGPDASAPAPAGDGGI